MSQVQFISYCVNLDHQFKKYPALDNYLDDINGRLTHLDRVIAQIKSDPKVKDKNTTKILMIPEFFWRGQKGYYPIDKITLKVGNTNQTYPEYLVKMLQSSMLNNHLENWVVIFGTAVYGWKAEKNTTYVYNCSLIQEGSFDDPSKAYKSAHLVQKEFKSDIDFVEWKKNPYEHLQAMKSSSLESELNSKGYDGNSIFQLHSIPIKVGVEICLDHLAERLKKAVKNSNHGIKVQLIPSAGMTIKKNSIVVEDGGYVFNCDGLNPYIWDPGKNDKVDSGFPGFHSQLIKKVKSAYQNIIPEKTIKIDFSKGIEEKLFGGKSGQIFIYPEQSI
ncbi:hypothetical protein D0962_07765 [Leptolyngbyaceae cyanobacterium CCMR0082]|uniref:CN hydrolase domain-containing protein n=2 Tax=Adonisia turfae TaxID=2950184 RepID=A0A6M0S2J8_9CYAN|nr:hypothetical protein [Adonisia turfae]NEZ59639.1 hypothetical protein [Adonisia turfae CCMR0081]NEZ62678.1 hypothetical protein [Adonisia turfae CCMR0082]